MNQNKKTICLIMIVKNEERQLPRCLNSVKNHIDYFVIIDTGSTDKTKEIIKEFSKIVPGELYERKWVNFGYNRTELLKIAKNKADYFLMCDADEEIVFLKEFDSSKLDKSKYMIKYNGNLLYRVPYLIDASIDWKFVGVTHEYLVTETEKNITVENLDTISINDYGDGGSKQNKFKRDIELLENALKQEPNNARYMFYLANSYKDIGNYEKAIYWYDKRIKQGGWDEEITCSYEYKGICQEKQGKYLQAIETWLRGFEYNPKRVECLYNAIRVLRKQGFYKTAYQLLLKAKTIPFPKDDILFVNKRIYEFELDYEETLLSYYENPNKDIRHLFKKLFIISNKEERNNLLSNYKFYSKSIDKFSEKIIYLNNYLKTIENYNNSTPCIVPYKNNKYLVNVRRVNYKITNNGNYEILNGNKINTLNTKIILNKNFKIIKQETFKEYSIDKKQINGIEDIRLLNTGNDIYFTGNIWINYNNIKVIGGKYENKELQYKIFKSPLNRNIEKNWLMFFHNNKIKYIYDWDPIIIGYIQNNEFLIDKVLDKSLPDVRGSSPGFLYDNYYYFLIHIVKQGKQRKYYHSILKLDSKTLEYVNHSNWFTFENKDIEYALGLIIEKDKVIVSYSIFDNNPKIVIYDKNKLFKFIF